MLCPRCNKNVDPDDAAEWCVHPTCPFPLPIPNAIRVEPGSLYDWKLSDDAKRQIEEIDRHIVRYPSVI